MGAVVRGPYDVWAPRPERLRLIVDGDGGGVVDMVRGVDDWWTPEHLPARATAGADCHYAYLVDDSVDYVPDPRSRRQDWSVHEWSRTFDPTTYQWSDTG